MKTSSQNPRDEIRRLQEQVQDFQQLTKVLESLSSTLHVEDTLKRIVEETLQLCDADQGSIFLFGPEAHQDPKTLIREGGSKEEKLDQYLNRLLAGWISAEQKPLLSNDLAAALGVRNIKEKHRNISSVLSMPLTLGKEMIGIINLISEQPGKTFGERELQVMNILAPQCARFIRNARLHDDLFAETERLKKEVQHRYERHGIIGHSPGMEAIFSLMDSIITTDVRVLIIGESGTGKERIARAVHYSGPHKDAPFVALDCGALPANLLESELFGYQKGAFTGANRDHKGLFEEAHGGTLFLDEIGNMPPEIQVKFLRALQEGEIRPLGSAQVKKVNVRIIAATNEDLEARVKDGRFRQDLYYRLNVVTLSLPPLRERKEDIALLANHFLQAATEKYHKEISGFSPQAISGLESYPWPGNIRELENAVERAVVLCKSQQLTERDFPFIETTAINDNAATEIFRPRALKDALTDLKRHYISYVLELTGGHQKQAAQLLHIQPTYLSRLIKELNIENK